MTILIVDDNEQNRYQLQVLLGGNGYQVAAAVNGAEALALARRQPPDMIISDILMPVMDGFTLCREWRNDERLRSIPFIFYTATYTDDRDREFALRLGAAQFLVKPEEPDVFLRTILDTLQQVRTSPRPAADAPPEEDAGYLKQYNEALIRKLEDKMRQLEDANRALERDIAERKRAEEEKTRLEAQLQQAQKMESVGRLAGGVAHDFNNMLGVILGHAEIAMDQIDPTHPIRSDLEEIRKAAGRSAELTRQLLAFARKQTVAPRVLDLNDTVSGMLTMLQRMIGENVPLAWQPTAALWPVRVDPSQIDQILVNLCVNARDAITDVGKITIATGNAAFDETSSDNRAGFMPGEYVRLAVSDTGCGMDKETLGHIFEPFFTTKTVGKGTGLGLATVYGIVKQNNGFIDVYSEPGLGTTFTIYLPRHLGKAHRPRMKHTPEPALGGHETVLLVEDEPAILKLTTIMLEKQGYTVLPVLTPGEAIRQAREYAGEIHLLMTDVVMPEMNGRDLARNLLSLYPQLKRLFTSGYTADVIAHHGELEEGVHFIQKPFSIKALAAKVRETLDAD